MKGKNQLTRMILWMKKLKQQKLKQKKTGTKTKGGDTEDLYQNILHKLHFENNSVKTAFYTTVKNLRGECKK